MGKKRTLLKMITNDKYAHEMMFNITIMREMKIKSSMRYHNIFTGMTETEESDNTKW